MREIIRRFLPFPIRLELLRIKRLPYWILEKPMIAHAKITPSDQEHYRHLLAESCSPLRRRLAGYDPRLQAGKEDNVALAASLLDGLIIAPNQIFSYYHTVGRPSRLRGFRTGLELHSGQPSKGIGGGCCQIANLLYVLALYGGMKIVERHRHALDLFPDEDRKVPFGCGATVFYNYADFRFENPLQQPVLLKMWIEEGVLRGRLQAKVAVPWTVEVYEVDHRFFQQEGEWFRENRIRRRFVWYDGSPMIDCEEAHNLGKVLYNPGEMGCGERS